MLALLFHLFFVTVLQLQCWSNSLNSVDFIEILPFLIRFEPFREPLMRFLTVFILLIQLYNADMTFKIRFATINFNFKESFDFFQLIS